MTATVTEFPGIRPWVEQHDRLAAGLPGAGLPWLDRLRGRALERFAQAGFPTPRTEAWKYTNLKELVRTSFAPAGAKGTANVDLLPTVMPAGGTPYRLVFVDGALRPELSLADGLPDGVVLDGLARLLAGNPALVEEHLGRIEDDGAGALAALNGAFLADGLILLVPPGVRLERPVEAVFLGNGGSGEGTPTAHHPRLLVSVGRGAEATLVEHHAGIGTGAYFSNVVSEVSVGDGARLHHYKIQAEGEQAFHVATLFTRLGRDASYDNFALTLGARLSRNELRPVLAGTGTECRLSGAYLIHGDQHADTTGVIDHAVPHGTSRQVHKGVIDGRARAVFQGKIVVRPDAQKTDGYQLNRALLLSDHAEIDSKPELEIHADDVKCSHGATAGELDDDQLFYLRARGIGIEEARNLLIEAFLLEAVDEIRDETVRRAFGARVRDWLEARRPAAA
jgi:Fe-S cluster assembly protein SufD